MGDPHFCWSDVERELKSWAATKAEAIDAVLTENERKFAEAMKAETDRRAALSVQDPPEVHGSGEKHAISGGLDTDNILCARRTAARGKSIEFTCTPGRWGRSSACR